MKLRTRAILFGCCSAPLLAILLLWVRGYWYCDTIGGPWGFTTSSWEQMPAGQHWYASVSCSYGQVRTNLTCVDCPEPGGSRCTIDTGTVPATPGQRWDPRNPLGLIWRFQLLGFVVQKDSLWVGGPGSGISLTNIRGGTLVLPYWLLATISAVPLLLLAPGLRRARRTRRRQRLGLCLRCGYDLRASPERCPECATPITPDLRPVNER